MPLLLAHRAPRVGGAVFAICRNQAWLNFQIGGEAIEDAPKNSFCSHTKPRSPSCLSPSTSRTHLNTILAKYLWYTRDAVMFLKKNVRQIEELFARQKGFHRVDVR